MASSQLHDADTVRAPRTITRRERPPVAPAHEHRTMPIEILDEI